MVCALPLTMESDAKAPAVPVALITTDAPLAMLAVNVFAPAAVPNVQVVVALPLASVVLVIGDTEPLVAVGDHGGRAAGRRIERAQLGHG